MSHKQPTHITAALSIGAAFVILVVIAVIGVFTLPQKQPAPTKSAAVPTVSVMITPAGFVPSAVTVHTGTHVTWTNQDDKLHQVAANPHPSGSSLPGLRSEILNHDQTYTFTATKTGSFGYHDQLNPAVNGTLEVIEATTKDKEQTE